MGNSLKCCIACMLPCGALDVVRVLHTNGRVEEYARAATAGQVMKANPKHVLAQPHCHGLARKTVILAPDAELHPGKIYVLIPIYALNLKHMHPKPNTHGRPQKLPLNDAKVAATSDKSPSPRAGEHRKAWGSPPPKKMQWQATDDATTTGMEKALQEEAAMCVMHDGKHFYRIKRRPGWKPVLQSIAESELL